MQESRQFTFPADVQHHRGCSRNGSEHTQRTPSVSTLTRAVSRVQVQLSPYGRLPLMRVPVLQRYLRKLLTVDLPQAMVLPQRLEINLPPAVTALAEAAVGRDVVMRAVASAVLQADAMEQALIHALPMDAKNVASGVSVPEAFLVRSLAFFELVCMRSGCGTVMASSRSATPSPRLSETPSGFHVGAQYDESVGRFLLLVVAPGRHVNRSSCVHQKAVTGLCSNARWKFCWRCLHWPVGAQHVWQLCSVCNAAHAKGVQRWSSLQCQAGHRTKGGLG